MINQLGHVVLGKCDECAIHHRSMCGISGSELQKEISSISRIRRVRAGETILAESAPSNIVGNVVSGALRLVKTLSDGRQQIVGLLLPSDMFGRVFASCSRFAVEAATDAVLCCFDRSAFEAILARHCELEHHMLLAALDELDAARDCMLLLGCQTVLERIATFVLSIYRRSAYKGCAREPGQTSPVIAIPISRRDLATYLGTTVETISRSIHLMARMGVIRILDPRHLQILNSHRLVQMSGREELGRSDQISPTDIMGRLGWGGGIQRDYEADTNAAI